MREEEESSGGRDWGNVSTRRGTTTRGTTKDTTRGATTREGRRPRRRMLVFGNEEGGADKWWEDVGDDVDPATIDFARPPPRSFLWLDKSHQDRKDRKRNPARFAKQKLAEYTERLAQEKEFHKELERNVDGPQDEYHDRVVNALLQHELQESKFRDKFPIAALNELAKKASYYGRTSQPVLGGTRPLSRPADMPAPFPGPARRTAFSGSAGRQTTSPGTFKWTKGAPPSSGAVRRSTASSGPAGRAPPPSGVAGRQSSSPRTSASKGATQSQSPATAPPSSSPSQIAAPGAIIDPLKFASDFSSGAADRLAEVKIHQLDGETVAAYNRAKSLFDWLINQQFTAQYILREALRAQDERVVALARAVLDEASLYFDEVDRRCASMGFPLFVYPGRADQSGIGQKCAVCTAPATHVCERCSGIVCHRTECHEHH